MTPEAALSMKLFDRLSWAKENLDPVKSDLVVVYEDEADGTSRIMVPDPNWMACARHGHILPPVDAYHRLETDGEGRVRNGHVLHESVVGPMTEEQAIQYLIAKDVPAHVWQDETANRPRFVICRREQLPESREWRNAWRLVA